MEKYIVWTDDERWIVRKNECAKFLACALADMAEDEYTDDEAMRYYFNETMTLLRGISVIDDDFIGICYTPMDNWFYISQDIVNEWKRGDI